jgi:MFS family permease
MAARQGEVVAGGGARIPLRSRPGALTLLLLCAVQFLDIVDTSIVNVALPSIQRSLHFSAPNLQWVASGYLLTYGGLLLLGGRLADLLGRRRMLITGLTSLPPSGKAATATPRSGRGEPPAG